jgi:hydroxyethylthiazole kinase-like uncharacterized protein yjeF
MKIFSAAQIKAWDAYTIEHEPIGSLALMERAASACVEWILAGAYSKKHFQIFCGKGNNGGDGLVIARLLVQQQYEVDVYILEQGAAGTPDFQTNLQRLHKCTHRIHFLQTKEIFPEINDRSIVVDALFGTGLTRPLNGLAAELIRWINAHTAHTLSIDIPSGMNADISSLGNDIVRADHTLSFQCWKQALLMEENAGYVGTVHILPIGLHTDFESNEHAWLQMITGDSLKNHLLPRLPFSHKGDYGHALMIAGSKGKIGAAVLAANACMRSGVGLLTVHLPECGYGVMQTALPEAMVSVDEDDAFFSSLPEDLEKYRTIGIGPGIGMEEVTAKALALLIGKYKQPMVLDADALNIIAQKGISHFDIPQGSIFTPHPGEFERLFGSAPNHFKRVLLALRKAHEFQSVIVLKSKYTLIACPDGTAWINPTGNPGMAKAGSGDVLTGIITGLLTRGYSSEIAARLGVYLHGYAGDLAVSQQGFESALASDITANLPPAFAALSK